MYAIIETGGTQEKVTEGQVIKVDNPNLTPDEEITFDKVKFFNDGETIGVGQPNLESVKVSGTVLKQIAGPKIRIHKFIKRKHSETRQGHRQKYSLVRITNITKD
ncbi:MAG: 50S ribosomal protein L21 [Planctomycetota bacterium]|jgi:large subunit ribosomal protein L21|nr:50S ribosomal protein L21 [Planctomycetota bacterium]MDP7250429.1 50S ribosomal protein L21 [Planctomycetota bacterium]